jgi:hypothetical protein
MNQTQRFFNRLREKLKIDVPSDAFMVRTHTGYFQRSAGAWTSVINSNDNRLFEIGLFEPIKELMKCPNLILAPYRFGEAIECGCRGKCKGRTVKPIVN